MNLNLQLTRDNHFKFGYNGRPFGVRRQASDKFFIEYGRCQRPVLDWRAECVSAAREIRSRTNKPLYLCFSGGLDSEVVAESLRFAQVPFRAAITRFKNDLNLHDIAWAVIYCEQHQIPYEFMELDIEEFYRGGEIWDYATASACIFPMLTPTMKLMEWVSQKGGFPILGSADCYLVKSPDGWKAQESEPIAAMFRFQIAKQIEAQAGFFVWNPEQILSFMLDPIVRQLVNNQIPGVTNSAQIKHRIYSQYFPRLQRREKYLGFEKIRELDAEMNKELEAKIIVGAQAFFYPYEKLVIDLQPVQGLSKS
jgi:hypothetical protein